MLQIYRKYALRVPPAVTRLTVYRRLRVSIQTEGLGYYMSRGGSIFNFFYFLFIKILHFHIFMKKSQHIFENQNEMHFRIWSMHLKALIVVFKCCFNCIPWFIQYVFRIPDFHHNFHYYDMCPKFFNWEIFFIWFPWSIGDVQWVFNLECFEYEPILLALNPEL